MPRLSRARRDRARAGRPTGRRPVHPHDPRVLRSGRDVGRGVGPVAPRLSVVGTSGSGKSTVGRAAAERLGVPFLELDSIRHQAGWQDLPDDEFRARTAEVVAGDGWVVDGNYRAVRPIVRARATNVVWLDLPRWRVMVQVVRRTLGRVVLRRELWNGNRERWRNLLTLDPQESIILWAWTTHARRRREYAEQLDETWVRLRSRREVRAWLDSL